MLTKNIGKTIFPKGFSAHSSNLTGINILRERTVSSVDQGMVPKAVLDSVLDQMTMLQKTVESLQTTIEKLNQIIEEKNQIILNQNRARFGQSSEQRKYVLSDGQMSMFDQAGDGVTEKASEDAATEAKNKEVTVAAHTRKPKRTLEELCANLETEYRDEDLPEEGKTTEDGRPLKCIGLRDIRTELVKEPARIYKRVWRCKVYVDPKAEAETGQAAFYQPFVPQPLLPHSYASASVVTDVMIRKFCDALPLYRQEQIWKRQGVELRRGTLANWVIQTSEIYLKPFSDAFLTELLSQPVIHADETAWQVNKEPGRAAAAESRVWAYASGKREGRQIRYFRYEPSRKGACAEEMLKGFTGVLVCDGYSGYNAVSQVTRAGCWAHMRRKWLEAMPKNATLENSLAAKGLDFCSRLFAMEQEMEQLSDDDRRKQRQLRSKPIVEEYYAWLDTIFKPSGKLKEAVTYAVRQRDYLCAFLEHGEIEISNNQVENAIRPIVVGRKNWLFCDTQAGANASTVTFSILETAKANGLNPEAYLLHLLTVLPDRCFLRRPNEPLRIDDLMPWEPAMLKLFGQIEC